MHGWSLEAVQAMADEFEHTPSNMKVMHTSTLCSYECDECEENLPTMRPPSPPVKSKIKIHGVDRFDSFGSYHSDENQDIGEDEGDEMRDEGRESQGQRKRVRWCDEAPDGSVPVSAGPGLEDVVAVEVTAPPLDVTLRRGRSWSETSAKNVDLSVHFEERKRVILKGHFATPPADIRPPPITFQQTDSAGISPTNEFAQLVKQEQICYREALQSRHHEEDEEDEDEDECLH